MESESYYGRHLFVSCHKIDYPSHQKTQPKLFAHDRGLSLITLLDKVPCVRRSKRKLNNFIFLFKENSPVQLQ